MEDLTMGCSTGCDRSEASLIVEREVNSVSAAVDVDKLLEVEGRAGAEKALDESD